MPSVYVVRWEKVADVSIQAAEELVESLKESDTTYPYYIDLEDYEKLSNRTRDELKELKKRLEDGEVLEVVVV
jgi:hypothetical protein